MVFLTETSCRPFLPLFLWQRECLPAAVGWGEDAVWPGHNRPLVLRASSCQGFEVDMGNISALLVGSRWLSSVRSSACAAACEQTMLRPHVVLLQPILVHRCAAGNENKRSSWHEHSGILLLKAGLKNQTCCSL